MYVPKFNKSPDISGHWLDITGYDDEKTAYLYDYATNMNIPELSWSLGQILVH